MEPIDTFEHRGLTIKIFPDPDAESPRENHNLGTMACWHRRYNLGDKQPDCDPPEYLESLLPDDIAERLTRRRERETDRIDIDLPIDAYRERVRAIDSQHRARVMAEVEKRNIVLPLYLFDHSGLTMNTHGFHCPWDSGQVGYIHVSTADVRKEWNVKAVTRQLRQQVIACLKSEVAVYATYLEGGFTGFVVEDEDGEHIDSCWGFDDIGFCREQAREAADVEADKREEDAKAEAAETEAESRAAGCP